MFMSVYATPSQAKPEACDGKACGGLVLDAAMVQTLITQLQQWQQQAGSQGMVVSPEMLQGWLTSVATQSNRGEATLSNPGEATLSVQNVPNNVIDSIAASLGDILPKPPSRSARTALPADMQAKKANLVTGQALVVGELGMIIAQLKRLLTLLSFSVQSSLEWSAARELFQNTDFDLVVMDLYNVEEEGLAMLENLKSTVLMNGLETRFVVLANPDHDAAKFEKRAKIKGADHVLFKSEGWQDKLYHLLSQ
jgi:CheY-like chemotaxis protein